MGLPHGSPCTLMLSSVIPRARHFLFNTWHFRNLLFRHVSPFSLDPCDRGNRRFLMNLPRNRYMVSKLNNKFAGKYVSKK